MEWVVELVSAIRTARAEMNVPAAASSTRIVIESTADGRAWIERHRRADPAPRAACDDRARRGAAQRATGSKARSKSCIEGATVLLDLAGAIDFDKERARLSREAAGLRNEIDKIEQKLANPQFVARAKPEVIEEQREREADARAALARVAAALQRIGA